MRPTYSQTCVLVLFALAGLLWVSISPLGFKSRKAIREELAASGLTNVSPDDNLSYIAQLGYGILGFGEAIWVGAKLGLLNRRFVCMFFFRSCLSYVIY
jgi:hypothetical protein